MDDSRRPARGAYRRNGRPHDPCGPRRRGVRRSERGQPVARLVDRGRPPLHARTIARDPARRTARGARIPRRGDGRVLRGLSTAQDARTAARLRVGQHLPQARTAGAVERDPRQRARRRRSARPRPAHIRDRGPRCHAHARNRRIGQPARLATGPRRRADASDHLRALRQLLPDMGHIAAIRCGPHLDAHRRQPQPLRPSQLVARNQREPRHRTHRRHRLASPGRPHRPGPVDQSGAQRVPAHRTDRRAARAGVRRS